MKLGIGASGPKNAFFHMSINGHKARWELGFEKI